MVKSGLFEIETEGFEDILDITGEVARIVAGSGLDAGITAMEYEPGAVEDLKKAIDRQAPAETHYDHDARWGDGNGFSHVRSALMDGCVYYGFFQYQKTRAGNVATNYSL